MVVFYCPPFHTVLNPLETGDKAGVLTPRGEGRASQMSVCLSCLENSLFFLYAHFFLSLKFFFAHTTQSKLSKRVEIGHLGSCFDSKLPSAQTQLFKEEMLHCRRVARILKLGEGKLWIFIRQWPRSGRRFWDRFKLFNFWAIKEYIIKEMAAKPPTFLR